MLMLRVNNFDMECFVVRSIKASIQRIILFSYYKDSQFPRMDDIRFYRNVEFSNRIVLFTIRIDFMIISWIAVYYLFVCFRFKNLLIYRRKTKSLILSQHPFFLSDRYVIFCLKSCRITQSIENLYKTGCFFGLDVSRHLEYQYI